MPIISCLTDTTTTVDEIYTSIFSFFWKRVVNIVSSEIGPFSNEKYDYFTIYRALIFFENITVFKKSVKKLYYNINNFIAKWILQHRILSIFIFQI